MKYTREVYIAGPMAGRIDENRARFHEVAAYLRRHYGYLVRSPAEMNAHLVHHPGDVFPGEYLRDDLAALVRCDAIVLLEGWEDSVGARCEVAVAKTIGLEFLAPDGTLLLYPPDRVVIERDYRDPGDPRPTVDLAFILGRQRRWSTAAFGPVFRPEGIVDHIRRELVEVLANPTDREEWIDVAMLALDGATRCEDGADPHEVALAYFAKLVKNEGRTWPDWRTADPDRAIEHVQPEAGR